jgi:hypothetical protein
MAIRLLTAVMITLLGPVGAVSTAHADTNDNKFLAALKSEGITDTCRPTMRSRPVIWSVRNLTRA